MMTFGRLRLWTAVIVLVAGVVVTASAQTFKMTTPIAPGVAVPDRIESSIGTLNPDHS